MLEVKVEKRSIEEKKSKVLGVIYGPDVKESVNVEIDGVTAKKLYDEAGKSSVVKLSVNGEAATREVLIRGASFHPLNRRIVHLEFYQVPAGHKLEVDVELNFIGIAPAEKELGGVVNKNMSSLPVKCFAADLVSSIDVDLASLKTFDDFIKVADLKLPKGMEAMLESDVIVATAVAVKAEAPSAPKVEAAEAAPATAAKKDSAAPTK